MAEQGYESHRHDAVVHDHEHFHVTHNWSEQAQTFVHLSSRHSHTHDHAELEHAHFPHNDFASEHLGEAHDHDHGTPVAPARKDVEPTSLSASDRPAKKAAAKKASAKGAKKSTAKRSAAKKSAKKA